MLSKEPVGFGNGDQCDVEKRYVKKTNPVYKTIVGEETSAHGYLSAIFYIKEQLN